MRRYEVRVVAARRVTPLMIRIRLTGIDLHAWSSTGRPDEYCQVFIPHGEGDPAARLYTVRRHDPSMPDIDIDVVDHHGGFAAGWACRVRPGDRLTIGPAAAGDGPGADRTRLHLIGDATALPAIGRAVEGSPTDVRVRVTGVVAGRAEQQTWRTAADAIVTWLPVPDLRDVPVALIDAVRALPDLGPTDYVWMAGEASAARAVRRHLRHDRGLTGSSFLAMGYWRLDAENWEARYLALADAVQRRIAQAAGELGADTDALYEAIDTIYDESGL